MFWQLSLSLLASCLPNTNYLSLANSDSTSCGRLLSLLNKDLGKDSFFLAAGLKYAYVCQNSFT